MTKREFLLLLGCIVGSAIFTVPMFFAFLELKGDIPGYKWILTTCFLYFVALIFYSYKIATDSVFGVSLRRSNTNELPDFLFDETEESESLQNDSQDKDLSSNVVLNELIKFRDNSIDDFLSENPTLKCVMHYVPYYPDIKTQVRMSKKTFCGVPVYDIDMQRINSVDYSHNPELVTCPNCKLLLDGSK